MKLTEMKNIGKTMQDKLFTIGISSKEELVALGSKEVFSRLKSEFPEVCLVHLYTLQAAIDNVEFNKLPEDTKKELKEFSDTLHENS